MTGYQHVFLLSMKVFSHSCHSMSGKMSLTQDTSTEAGHSSTLLHSEAQITPSSREVIKS